MNSEVMNSECFANELIVHDNYLRGLLLSLHFFRPLANINRAAPLNHVRSGLIETFLHPKNIGCVSFSESPWQQCWILSKKKEYNTRDVLLHFISVCMLVDSLPQTQLSHVTHTHTTLLQIKNSIIRPCSHGPLHYHP
jgi:hypothetical protein